MADSLILISEFGEELKGNIRKDFVQRLQHIYKRKFAFLLVDVGITVQMGAREEQCDISKGNQCSCQVLCVICGKLVNIGDADFQRFGPDNALYCVCKTCGNNTSMDILQTKLRTLYEIGYEIKTKVNDNVSDS